MRLIKVVLLGIALFLTAQNAVYGKGTCVRDNAVNPLIMNVNFGHMTVSPTLPVGGQIGETISIDFKPNVFYYKTCGVGEIHLLDGTYSGSKSVESNGYNTYPTGVEGIGLQIILTYAGNDYHFGGTTPRHNIVSSFKSPNGYGLSFYKYGLKARLIKTKEKMGSGELIEIAGLLGKLRLYDHPNDKEVAQVRISAVITPSVIAPSCSLESTNGGDLNITLNPVKLSDFNGVGSTAGDTPFDFKLKCEGGMDQHKVNILTYFTSGNVEPIDFRNGVFANMSPVNAANNIGIQVLIKDKPLAINEDYNIGVLGSNTPTYSTPMVARYYQHGPHPSAGRVESYMVYNIYYD